MSILKQLEFNIYTDVAIVELVFISPQSLIMLAFAL